MAFGQQARRWLQRGVMALGALALVLGCRDATPTAALGAGGASAPLGSVDLTLDMPLKPGAAAAGQYSVQFVDWNIASYVRLYVAGVGLHGWIPCTINGKAVAYFWTTGKERIVRLKNVSMPTGPKRIVRADIFSSTKLLMHEVWGLVDVPEPGVAAAVYPLTDYTTPTAKIFRDLITTGDPDRALGLAASEVQQLVDDLLDTEQTASGPVAVDGNQDGQTRLVHPALLRTEPLAIAIANGAKSPPGTGARVPYTVPSPAPAPKGFSADNPDLAPTPVQQATVVIKTLDGNGAPVANTSLFWVNDVATPIVSSNAGEVSFPGVALGPNRTAMVVDTVTGKRASVAIVPDLVDGETRTVMIAMPFNRADRVFGSYDLTNWRGYGFNGERTHASIAYLNTPRHLTLHKDPISGNTHVYFVDLGNQRIRSVKLGEPDAMVETVAGATAGELSLLAETDLAIDGAGDLLFTEKVPGTTPVYRVGRIDVDPATGRRVGGVVTAVDMANVTGWTAGTLPTSLAYEAATGLLYVAGGKVIVRVRLADPAGTGQSVYPAAGSSELVTTGFNGGGIAVAGGHLFYSTVGIVSYTDASTDPPTLKTVRTHTLMRRRLSDAATVAVVGDPKVYTQATYGFKEALNLGYTVPATNFFQPSPFHDLSVDSAGNLYYMTFMPTNKEIHYYYHHRNLIRVSDALSGDATTKPWLVTYMDLHTKLGMAKWNKSNEGPLPAPLEGLAITPDVPAGALINDLLCTGITPYSDPNGAGTVPVHAIYRVRL